MAWISIEEQKRGVPILIHKKWKNTITNWVAIDERVLKLDMNICGYKLTVFGVYAPIDDNATANLENDIFFDKVNEEIGKISAGSQLILLGDMNGRIGSKSGDPVIGNFGEAF